MREVLWSAVEVSGFGLIVAGVAVLLGLGWALLVAGVLVTALGVLRAVWGER